MGVRREGSTRAALEKVKLAGRGQVGLPKVCAQYRRRRLGTTVIHKTWILPVVQKVQV